MTMGIERALRATFGDAVKEVIEVGGAGKGGGPGGSGPPPATVEAIDGHLDTLRPALSAYGATVTPLSISGGVCTVRFTGPAPILMGVTAALKDRFPDVKDVKTAE
jgi:Fe-S cluster biogenesis protein NfuA